MQPEESTPHFREVRFLDPNSLELPDRLRQERFLPLEIVSFKVEDVTSYEHIHVTLSSTNTLHSTLRLYACQDSQTWQELPHEFLDANTARITLSDGGGGDYDRDEGTMSTMLVFTYPRELNVQVKERGCFIEAIRDFKAIDRKRSRRRRR